MSSVEYEQNEMREKVQAVKEEVEALRVAVTEKAAVVEAYRAEKRKELKVMPEMKDLFIERKDKQVFEINEDLDADSGDHILVEL